MPLPYSLPATLQPSPAAPVSTAPPIQGWWPKVYVDFTLNVAPSLGSAAAARSSLLVRPSLSFTAASTMSTAGFNLAVPPSLDPSAGSGGPASAGLAVPPMLAFAGSSHSTAGFNLAVPPALGGSGASASTGGFALAVPPSLAFTGTASVLFDAVGGGYGNVTGNAPSWSHTLSTSANAIVVLFETWANTNSETVTAKVGSTSMTQLGVISNYTTSSGYYASVTAFGLMNPPTGAQTINTTTTGTCYTRANSMSFLNATGFGTPVTASGSGAPSMSVSPGAGQMVAQAFGGYTTTFSSYSQTQEYNQPFSGGLLSFVMGYGAGTSSLTFSATGTQPWGGIAVPVT